MLGAVLSTLEGLVSTVTGSAFDTGLSLPAASVKLYASWCGPSASGVVGVSVPVAGL